MAEKFDINKIQGIVFGNSDEKAIGRGRRIGKRFERFDPNAIDGDNDGTVQEGTSFERPAGPQNMPKTKPIEVPEPAEVPIPQPKPNEVPTPSRPQPARPEPAVPAGRRISGSVGKTSKNNKFGVPASLRKSEIDAANALLDVLEKDQARIKKIKNKDARIEAIRQHNLLWNYAQKLIDDDFDTNSYRAIDFTGDADMMWDLAGGNFGHPNKDVTKATRDLYQSYIDRAKYLDKAKWKPKGKPEPEPKLNTRLSGSIGKERDNSITPDDEPFGEGIFDPKDIDELDRLQGEVLDEIADGMSQDTDWDAEMERILGPDADADPEDLKEAQRQIDAIKDWMKDHPFNRDARNYEEREWADNEFDGQAERYAPAPPEITSGEEIDWDKLRKTAGLTPQQKEDYELTDEELADRQAQRAEKLGPDPAAVSERATIWNRVQNGEGFREIAPDYPDMHWTLVRDMSRQGAAEAGASKQDSQNAERAARVAARERALNAASERLMDRMLSATSASDLKNRLDEEIEQAKNLRKRVSNEYQMIRKKQVELWRLASMAFETMPEKNPGEGTMEYLERMREWFFSVGPQLRQFALDINSNYDITTATNRSYDHQTELVDMLQDKRRNIQQFWADLQAYKTRKSSGGLSGSMGGTRRSSTPRGVRLLGVAAAGGPRATAGGPTSAYRGRGRAADVDFRELDAINEQLNRLAKGSFSNTGMTKRPPNMNKSENALLSRARAAKKFPRGFFRPRRGGKKPKKA